MKQENIQIGKCYCLDTIEGWITVRIEQKSQYEDHFITHLGDEVCCDDLETFEEVTKRIRQ